MRTEISFIWNDYFFVYNSNKNACMQELDHTQNFTTPIPIAKGHSACKNLIQTSFTTPNDLIVTVNRFTYINNSITKNRSLIPLNLNTILGPYKFSLKATVDHHLL